MAKLLEIAQLGAPILRQRAAEVDKIDDPEVQSLIDNMFFTCEANDGMGIAAPQVGIPLRVIIVATKPSLRYPQARQMKPLALINPTIQVKLARGGEGWEGSLSLPGLHAKVWRSDSVTLVYLDRHGIRRTKTFTGFAARVAQHEIDHLDGIMFFDEADKECFLSEKEFQRMMQKKRH